jgi:hypothetical protein
MDEKISTKAVDAYSREYATRLLDAFFVNHDRITGPEILALSPVRQVNLFVVYAVFKSWKTQMDKARSPYFEFRAEPVQEALENLKVALSNHISIRRSDLEALLQHAVRDALMLIVDPYDFFADLIEENDTVYVQEFREHLKYIKVNRAPLEQLLKKMDESGKREAGSNEVFGLLDSILEEVSFTPEDIDDYLVQFSKTLPLAIENLYELRKPAPAPPKSEPKSAVHEVIGQLQPAKPTVNEKLAQSPKATVADNFKRIGKIKDSLTINQKFMFTKVLFHGDFELFSQAVDDLDKQDSLQGALRYLELNYEEWDRESEEFHEFMELVEKRFS